MRVRRASEPCNFVYVLARYEHITRDVLDKLLGTSFATHVDAPSLSLASGHQMSFHSLYTSTL